MLGRGGTGGAGPARSIPCDRRELATAGELIASGPGQAAVTQGDPSDAFYVILEGAADVRIDGKPVRTLAPGDWFGEIALLHSVPRTATVTTTTESKLWSLGRDAFLMTLGDGAPADGAAGAAGAAAVPGAGLIV